MGAAVHIKCHLKVDRGPQCLVLLFWGSRAEKFGGGHEAQEKRLSLKSVHRFFHYGLLTPTP